MEIDFCGEYDKSLYIKAFRKAYNPSTWKTFILSTLLVLLVILYLGYAIYERDNNLGAIDIFRTFHHLYKFLIVAIFIFLPHLLIYRKAIKLWNEIAGQEVFGCVTNLGIKLMENEGLLTWGNIKKVIHSEKMMGLVTINDNFFLLPCDFFESESDWRIAQSLVTNNVKPIIK
ncbi:MAG: hypothetical protein JW908_07255 [Anaerolineales bacterium]|nr:hypothetical protein [Anaerolineales bacterium]